MNAEDLAKLIVDNNLQVPVIKAIRIYEQKLASEMIVAGCKQVDVRKRFGNTKGTVYWCRHFKLPHCHTYHQDT